MAATVLDAIRPVAAVAADYGCTWNTCHGAVEATADALLDSEPAPITVLGIDETRRGKVKYETCPDTGKRVWIDRFDTGLVDITGNAGLLAQVNDRSAKPVSKWLGARTPGGGSRSSMWRSTCQPPTPRPPTTPYHTHS